MSYDIDENHHQSFPPLKIVTDRDERTESAFAEVKSELERASRSYGRFNSAHEGFAVLNEEVDELWDEVKKNSMNRSPRKLRAEAVQVAAMALRFIIDVA